MNRKYFLTLLQETHSHIKWYVDTDMGCIRGRLRFDSSSRVCPITGVAWYLGHHFRTISEIDMAASDIGLSWKLAFMIADASDKPRTRAAVRSALLTATGLA